MASTAPLRVLHLVGSPTSEFFGDLSRLYAADCLEATADETRYEFHIAHVTPDRRWSFPTDLGDATLTRAPTWSLADAVARIAALDIDVVVPQMFCIPGMTAYRALFDVLGIPYVGNTPAVMALGADKAAAKAVVAAAGVAVPAGQLLRRGDEVRVAPPAVVKPVDADNSVGVALVRAPDEFPQALAEAFAHADRVLVEPYVELGREVRCGAVEREGRLVCLPLEEYAVDSTRKPIRPYHDKISRGADGGLNLVAKDAGHAWIVDPSDPVTPAVWEAAAVCHRALGCRHYSLFDFRIDPAGRPWFLEAGLYSSFARTSVISVMAAAAGMPLDELFAGLLGEAIGADTPHPALGCRESTSVDVTAPRTGVRAARRRDSSWVPTGRADTRGEPMTTPTDTRRDLLTVIARMHAKPGKERELREALESLIEPTVQEKGCVNYDLHQGVEDEGWFFFYENWDSAEDLDAHLAAPHLVEFAGRLGDLLDESGLVIERVRRIA